MPRGHNLLFDPTAMGETETNKALLNCNVKNFEDGEKNQKNYSGRAITSPP